MSTTSARDAGQLRKIFEQFGERECPQLDGHLYAALCRGIVNDEELLGLAAHAPPTQPPPNLLFAAVHYLLLGGEEHPLRAWYPALAEGEVRDPSTALPAFRAFCREHSGPIAGLIEKRLTQTNVVQRCSALLPAFARVHAAETRPLALIEIGPSAGLNLLWDRFRYVYDDGALSWGRRDSPVVVPCELRGGRGLPALPDPIPVAWRRGIDLHPIDVADSDAVQWLRALVWPDHVGRQERLSCAIALALREPPEIVTADASQALEALLASAPPEAALCVYGTHTLYQFSEEARHATYQAMQRASLGRGIDFLSIEGTGDRCSELKHSRYRAGERETTLLANCNPHGRWLEWLAA